MTIAELRRRYKLENHSHGSSIKVPLVIERVREDNGDIVYLVYDDSTKSDISFQLGVGKSPTLAIHDWNKKVMSSTTEISYYDLLQEVQLRNA
jgi:hypothetical protein